ncbi:EamA-like transporter family protein [Nonlabens dokdonensis]|uniref:EamA-like transporter family protein n=2 Tax=Nonlabens dokdonensis TaxID=328515 RepID=A0ABX5PZN0_9FLAO|nr:DMT family transporter [Nonlabens dokdonensis]AGC75342.1 putative permease [Nonlabens dokdonensis DSW-6]PZX43048.1 EamA-like transporter family protein [Nonlabens dokdonensis]
MQDDKLLNYLHLHFIVFIWGFTAVLGALISIDSIPLVWWRMGIAVVLIFIYMKWKKIPLQLYGRDALSRKRILGFLLAGVVIALHWVTFFGAIKESNVSVTLAMMSMGAFFTALLEPLFTSKKFVWYELLFGAIIIAALYYIFKVETEYVTGMILGLVSALLSAIFSIMNVRWAKENPPSLISFYELLSGVALLSLFFIFLPVDFVMPSQLTSMDWLWIGILASVCTAYAFIASVKVMKFLSAYTVMLTINLEPVYGIFLAFLILGDSEEMTPDFYFGAILILIVIMANGILKTRFSKK